MKTAVLLAATFSVVASNSEVSNDGMSTIPLQISIAPVLVKKDARAFDSLCDLENKSRDGARDMFGRYRRQSHISRDSWCEYNSHGYANDVWTRPKYNHEATHEIQFIRRNGMVMVFFQFHRQVPPALI